VKQESFPISEDAWAEIDLSAISHNISAVRRILAPGCRLMAAVKANAYGHGLLAVSIRALAAGADALGVARLSEALQLREAGIAAPVLIFGHTPPSSVGQLLRYNLTQSVYGLDTARPLSEAAESLGGRVRAHVKIDTGMGRLGILAAGAVPVCTAGGIAATGLEEAAAVCALPGIRLEGIYTHFAAADEADKGSAYKQLAVFHEFTEALKTRGIEFAIRHAANSAATIDMPEAHLDMVRPGIAVYGIYPSETVDRSRILLKPAMALKTRVIHLKRVEAGFPVSYGGDAVTTRSTLIATVAIGYGDGYRRLLSRNGRMLVRGKGAPVIGRVCMDQTMLDATDIPEIRVGDEVAAIGSQGDVTVTADEVAEKCQTISYEIVAGVSERVERVYLE
jgi:alanine racemase